jgi:hypothetical protein
VSTPHGTPFRKLLRPEWQVLPYLSIAERAVTRRRAETHPKRTCALLRGQVVDLSNAHNGWVSSRIGTL